MSGIVDPSTPEREARGNATNAVIAWCFDRMTAEQRDAMLDTYAAAVYARALADVAGWVEGMRLPHDGNCSSLWSAEPNHPFCDCQTQPHNAALDALLAKMREAK